MAKTSPPPIPGELHLTRRAIAGAIRAAFGTSGDPRLLAVTVSPQLKGYRATLALAADGRSIRERKHWLQTSYFQRWAEIEQITGTTIYLRREWCE